MPRKSADKPSFAETNKAAIGVFALSFDPKPNIVATLNLNGQPVQDAFMCAAHDPNTGLGMTAVVFGRGKFKAWIELAGTADQAKATGAIFAEAMKKL